MGINVAAFSPVWVASGTSLLLLQVGNAWIYIFKTEKGTLRTQTQVGFYYVVLLFVSFFLLVNGKAWFKHQNGLSMLLHSLDGANVM